MFPQPRSPILTPRPASLILPPKQPFSLHPSCVLALLPQHDDKWFDYSGKGNHGTVFGATPTAKGPHGFAYSFDGVDDYVGAGNDASLDITDAITIVARVKHTAWKAFAGVVGRGNVNNGYHLIHNHLGRQPRFSLRNAPVFLDITSPEVLALNTWYHIVGTYDGSVGRVHVNRVEKAHQTTSLTFAPPAVNALKVGFTDWPGVEYLNGLIDEGRIYNQAWSPNPADPNYLPEIDPGPPPYD